MTDDRRTPMTTVTDTLYSGAYGAAVTIEFEATLNGAADDPATAEELAQLVRALKTHNEDILRSLPEDSEPSESHSEQIDRLIEEDREIFDALDHRDNPRETEGDTDE